MLSPAPDVALDVLEAEKNNAIDAWVVDLDRHMQKLDACRAIR